MKFLGNRTAEDFFKTHWEQEPLHVAGAVEIPQEVISEEDIIEMEIRTKKMCFMR